MIVPWAIPYEQLSLKAFLFVSINQENSHWWLSQAEKGKELIVFRFTYIFTTQKIQLDPSFQTTSLMLFSEVNPLMQGFHSLSVLYSNYHPLPVMWKWIQLTYHKQSWHIPSLCYKAQTVFHALFSGALEFPYPFQCQTQVTNCAVIRCHWLPAQVCTTYHTLLIWWIT